LFHLCATFPIPRTFYQQDTNAVMKKIVFTLPIYTFQIDFNGHVNNAIFIHWMEIGRTKFLDEIGLSIPKTGEQGYVPILAETNIKYKHPLYLEDQVRIELWLSKLGYASARIEFRFYNSDGVLAATGSQLGLFVDTATMKPHRLSKEDRALFSEYLS